MDGAFTGHVGDVVIRYAVCFIARLYVLCFLSAMFLNPVCCNVYCHPSHRVSCTSRCTNVTYRTGVRDDDEDPMIEIFL